MIKTMIFLHPLQLLRHQKPMHFKFLSQKVPSICLTFFFLSTFVCFPIFTPTFSLLTFFWPPISPASVPLQWCAGAFNLLVARPTACVRTPAILLMHPTGKCKAGEAQVAGSCGSCRSYDEVLLGIYESPYPTFLPLRRYSTSYVPANCILWKEFLHRFTSNSSKLHVTYSFFDGFFNKNKLKTHHLSGVHGGNDGKMGSESRQDSGPPFWESFSGNLFDTVDGSEIRRFHQLRLVVEIPSFTGF